MSADDDTGGQAGGDGPGARSSGSGRPRTHSPAAAEEEDEEEASSEGFGRPGWVLVGVVVLSALVVPGVIYAVPSLPGRAGLPFFAAMLALPLVPAVLLGLVGIWSMTAGQRTEK